MQKRVFIDGAHGTTGLKIRRLLSARDDIELLSIDESRRKDLAERVRMTEQADVSILCLPDAASAELAAAVPDSVRLIDTSTAHRTAPGWVYGMAELCPGQREKIRTGNRIANPGCHATGFIVLVRPLVEAGILAPDYPAVCFCVTGYSGGGKKMIADYEREDRAPYLDSPGQYGLSQRHKHLPEMQEMGGLSTPPSFCPVVSDFYSGMVMTVPLRRELMKKHVTPAEVNGIYRDYYRGEALIRVREELPEDGFLHSSILSGSDALDIFTGGNDERPLVFSRFDNLGKGASGTAVQNLNIMLGIEETKGLSF